MVAITTQVGIANMTGLAEQFRTRSTGKIVTEGDVRDINGFKIDVTGSLTRWEETTRSTVALGKGVRAINPQAASDMMAPSTLSASIKTQELGFDPAQIAKARALNLEGTAFEGMAMAESVEITHTETLPIEQVQGLGFYDRQINSREEDIAYLTEMLARGGELAGIESQLSQEYGEPVKLAWDAVAQEYLMLRAGQDGYGKVRSAQEVFRRDIDQTLRQMGYSKNDFAAVLKRYDVKA